MNAPSGPVRRITGAGLVLGGDDVETNRILPTRFARHPTADVLGRCAFADDRLRATAAGAVHPFEDPRHAGASTLVTGRNFGCGPHGHAALALRHWGVRAIAGAGFGEAFRDDCTAIGLPCVELDVADAAELAELVTAEPRRELVVDLDRATLRAGTWSRPAGIPAAARSVFVDGRWEVLTELVADPGEIVTVTDRLPYLAAFGYASRPLSVLCAGPMAQMRDDDTGP